MSGGEGRKGGGALRGVTGRGGTLRVCPCCDRPFAACECDDFSPPPCARCFHCHTHCKCGKNYVEATPEILRQQVAGTYVAPPLVES
jgi:hypothetical protein